MEIGKRGCFLSVGCKNLKEGEHPDERKVAFTALEPRARAWLAARGDLVSVPGGVEARVERLLDEHRGDLLKDLERRLKFTPLLKASRSLYESLNRFELASGISSIAHAAGSVPQPPPSMAQFLQTEKVLPDLLPTTFTYAPPYQTGWPLNEEVVDIPGDQFNRKQKATLAIPGEGLLSVGVVGGNLYGPDGDGPYLQLPMPER